VKLKPRLVRVYLVNVDTLHAMCGWGEGKSEQQAVEAALRKARETDPAAWYQPGVGVCFHGGANR
jgi:hypothetical protein